MARTKVRGSRDPADRTVKARPAPPRRAAARRRDQTKAEENPSTPSSWYEHMSPSWLLMSDVIGGTRSMRGAGSRRMPPHSAESDDSWNDRLNSAVLLNVTKMTGDTLAGYPFSEPVVLETDVPKAIREMAEDIDMRGTHLDVFAKEWFLEALYKSFSHVLVEFPTPAPREDGLPRTLEDDRLDGLRPYWVRISPEDLIAAIPASLSGREVLGSVRYNQTRTVRVGFSEVHQRTIVEREIGRQRTWLYDEEKDEWNVEVIPDFTGADGWFDIRFRSGKPAPITMVTLYTDRTGFMTGEPRLEDLAHLNVRHWQSYSDQINILTVTRFPMLACSGVSQDEFDSDVEVGPNRILFGEAPESKYYFVEHAGAATETGEKDLTRLEDQMSAYGADFLKKRPTVYTVGGRQIDQNGILSPLQSMTISARDAIEQALLYTANWIGLDDGGSVKLNMEFGTPPVDSADMAALQEAWDKGAIDDQAYLNELVRRKTLTPDLDITAQVAGIEARQKKKLQDALALKPKPAPVAKPAPGSGSK